MASSLILRWSDLSGMRRMENALGRLTSDQREHVFRRAINHIGDKARTVVVRTLAKQTGLPYRTIRRAVKVSRANYRSFDYVMSTAGGDVSLKYFKPRETRAGVTAAPFGKRQLFAGDFLKAGHFPNRVTATGLGGHVYEPDTSVTNWGRPISLVNSGVIIPAEMVHGETAETFMAMTNADLPSRVMHEIGFMLPGFFD